MPEAQATNTTPSSGLSAGAPPPPSPSPSSGTSTAGPPAATALGTGVVAPSPSPPAIPAPAAAQPPPAPTRKVLGEADDLPDDADVYEISKSALRKRLERHSRGQLKQLFGTDNVEEIVGWKTAAEQAAQREEEARLAQMSEADRYKAQFERAQQQVQHWRGQYEQLQEQHELREQDRQIMSLAARHVDPDCVDYVSMQLAQHLREVDEQVLAGDPSAYVNAWVQQYVADHPKFGLAPTQPPAAQAPPNGMPGNVHNFTPPGAQNGNGSPPPRQVQIPISNGPGASRPAASAAPGAQMASKTLAPGHANSMTDDEVRAWKRANGHDW